MTNGSGYPAIGPASPEPTFRHALRHLARAFSARFRDELAKLGVSEPEYQAMFALRRIPDISSADLARWIGVSAQATNVVVRSLERKGSVQRVPSPTHGRVLRLRLSESGLVVIEECERRADELELRMLSDIDEHEREVFEDFLRRGASSLGAPIATGDPALGWSHPTPK